MVFEIVTIVFVALCLLIIFLEAYPNIKHDKFRFTLILVNMGLVLFWASVGVFSLY